MECDRTWFRYWLDSASLTVSRGNQHPPFKTWGSGTRTVWTGWVPFSRSNDSNLNELHRPGEHLCNKDHLQRICNPRTCAYWSHQNLYHQEKDTVEGTLHNLSHSPEPSSRTSSHNRNTQQTQYHTLQALSHRPLSWQTRTSQWEVQSNWGSDSCTLACLEGSKAKNNGYLLNIPNPH